MKTKPTVEQLRDFAERVRELFRKGLTDDDFENGVLEIEKALGMTYNEFQNYSDLNDPLQIEWIE